MNNFDKKNLLELKKASLEEVEKYYLELRKHQYDNDIPIKGIEIRKKIHKLLVSLIKIDRLLQKEELIVISDKHEKKKKPIIYACTHIGGNDIQRTFEAIKDHAYLFLGDPKEIYRDMSGLLLYLNGVICLDTSDKNDRHIAMERSKELLNKNGSLLIYPEGAWNITENLPVTKLYLGTVKMAIETNADIVPIAIEQYDNKFFVNIGENIEINRTNDFNTIEINELLRDKMATLKWEIWEKQGLTKRQNITEDFKKHFQESIIEKCEYNFTIEDVYATMLKDPNEITYDEVFAFRKKLGR